MMTPDTRHLYTSTYCMHSQHGNCRLRCKICSGPCLCPCHGSLAHGSEVWEVARPDGATEDHEAWLKRDQRMAGVTPKQGKTPMAPGEVESDPIVSALLEIDRIVAPAVTLGAADTAQIRHVLVGAMLNRSVSAAVGGDDAVAGK